MKQFCIIIYGATGVGKSEFAERLAEEQGGEIINCDVGQFYTPLSIGTAKPQWKGAQISHHLFDILEEPRNFSILEYRALVEKKIQEIWSRHKIPFIVGGSGFYIRSLLYALENFSPRTSSEHLKHYEFCSTKELWDKLYKIDYSRANKIHKNDRYRITRALSLWEQGRKTPSLCKAVYAPLSPFLIIHLTREKEQLYERINNRVKMMFEEGWQQEVSCLNKEWQEFIIQKKIIGYNELVMSCSHQEISLLQNTIAQRTRRYAKRQNTFWNGMKRDFINEQDPHNQLQEINLTFSSLDLYINEMRIAINKYAST